ncbi:YjfB family protein [Herbivorax sp. ANBcel31]|uniref:YjfB family protein n=1 Tax=Herbivorax sp. ANBcel31 TaxID=3069754 RepID=UPI0027AE0BBD|nr:YjfB family protein [Herbivorax sp. ANBcel31]MDQ2085092.1 YjfB family protein [Herbivorax sp. ANBcel31]
MDVAAMSTMLSQSQIKQQASISVLKMAMDTGKRQMQDMTQMLNQNTKQMEQAVNPSLGKNIDVNI